MRISTWPPLRRCPATLACTGILTAVYIAEWILGAFALDPLPMLALGANSSDLVGAGEWQRLVTGNLLHGGFLHFSLNAMGLLYLGGYLELLLGVPRFLALLLVSCLGGSLTSAFFTDSLIAVGVSTGLLGLVGAMVVFTWRFSDDRRATIKSLGYFTLLTVAVSLPMEWALAKFLFIRVDHFGHLGGLMAGVLFVVVAIRERSLRTLHEAKRDPLSLVFAVALVLLFLGTAGWTAFSYATRGLSPAAASFLTHVELPEDRQEALAFKFFFNNAAWTLALDPEASRPELETARAAMDWVLAEDPLNTLAERDTLATLAHRLGDHETAVAIERQVLELSQDPRIAQDPELRALYAFEDDDIAFFASQLARFEWARASLPGGDAPEVRLTRSATQECTGLLIARDGWGQTSEIHITLVRGDAPIAFVKVVAGPEAPAWLEYDKIPNSLLDCDVRPVVTLMETGVMETETDNNPSSSHVEWQFWAMSADAAEMP